MCGFWWVFFLLFLGGWRGGGANISAGVTVFVTAVASVCVCGGGGGGVRACKCVFKCLRAWVHVCMRARVYASEWMCS